MSGSGQVALPDVQVWSGDPAECPGVVGGPPDVREGSRMSRRGREALPNVRALSEGPHGCLGVVGRPSWMSLRVGRPFRMCGKPSWLSESARRPSEMSGSGRESIPYDQGALPNVRYSLVILPDVREWSGGPPGCPGIVGWPSRMSGSGRDSLPNVQEWSGNPP